MITNVKGEFRQFDAVITSHGSDFGRASVEASIDAASIFTNNTDRDNHLRSADFFDAGNFPKLRFKGTEFVRLDDENYRLTGLLTIKDIVLRSHTGRLEEESAKLMRNEDPEKTDKLIKELNKMDEAV